MKAEVSAGVKTLLLLAACVLPPFLACTGCTPPPLSPAEDYQITITVVSIAHCQNEGRKANSYAAYDCCMLEAGLHPGLKCGFDAGGGND